MPLARLQLRLSTREEEKRNLNQWERKYKNPWYLSFPWQSPPLPVYSPVLMIAGASWGSIAIEPQD